MKLCDGVRETGFAIHRYHKRGHLEKVYENALAHRLRKLGLDVKQQYPLKVYDEDGTLIGDYNADLFVDNRLLIELKAAKALADEPVAQILGYLGSSGVEHGLLINFGAPKFEIKKYALSRIGEASRPGGLIGGTLSLFGLLRLFAVGSPLAFEASLGTAACQSTALGWTAGSLMTLLPSRMVWSRLVNCLPRAAVFAEGAEEDAVQQLLGAAQDFGRGDGGVLAAQTGEHALADVGLTRTCWRNTSGWNRGLDSTAMGIYDLRAPSRKVGPGNRVCLFRLGMGSLYTKVGRPSNAQFERKG